MTQTSANREPSMEEILASIRRIIENTDLSEDEPTRVAANDRAGEPRQDDASDSYSFDESPRDHEASEPARPASFTRSSDGGDMVAPTVSLADVAARIRASGGTASGPRSTGPGLLRPAAHVQGNAAVRFDEDIDALEDNDPDLVVSEDVIAAFRPGEAASAERRQPRDGSSDPFDNVPEAGHVLSGLSSMETELAVDVERAVSSGREEESEPASASPAVSQAAEEAAADPGRQLMSADAGAKVTAAFDDLSEAFNFGPSRSFDEIAEEMLRPMLQQWLDDNLPTLVERLVREEIERVARGGRR